MPDPDGPETPTSLPDGTLTGRILDERYQVAGVLGRGGMSEVYLGRQLALDRPCAIKVMHPSTGEDPSLADRFRREAAALSRIDHPNVCPVIDFGTTAEGLRYLVMSYLEGESLAAVLRAGPMELPRARRLVADSAAGLQAAHDAGVVHRDIKPDNVMLISRGGRESAVLIDFGIARPESSGELTRDGMMVGTPEFMSPEQIAGDPVGPASDQYQLALLLIRVVSGTLPFPGDTTQERMASRLRDAPRPLRELAPAIPVTAAIQSALDRALARRPADRFPSVHDFVSALDTGDAAPPATPTEVLVRPLPPRGPGVGPAATIRRAAVLAGIVFLVWLAWPETTGDTPEPGKMPAPDSVPATLAVPAPPASPSPGPAGGREPPPVLPSEEQVFSTDPEIRRGARERAEQVYRSPSAADTVKAEAAYLIAGTHLVDGAHGEARTWLQYCLALQERPMCRRLLSQLP